MHCCITFVVANKTAAILNMYAKGFGHSQLSSQRHVVIRKPGELAVHTLVVLPNSCQPKAAADV